jgi:hypothetical protein
LRVLAEEANDFFGMCDIDNQEIFNAARARGNMWANDHFKWLDESEREIF